MSLLLPVIGAFFRLNVEPLVLLLLLLLPLLLLLLLLLLPLAPLDDFLFDLS